MVSYRQLSAFGVSPEKSGKFNVYHDESGTDSVHDRFQLHGALIIPINKIDLALEQLEFARNGYLGQVHFVKLRDNTTSRNKIIASDWLKIFLTEILKYSFYKCMVIDTYSPAFERARFPHNYLLYNYAAMLAINGGITWSLHNFDHVEINIFSEELDRSDNDNFETYLPNALANRSRINKKCPDVTIPLGKVVLVKGDPRKVEPKMADHCEFIQLTDVITGAIDQALNAKASQKVKINLGKLAADWIEDTRLPPWLQVKQLHRRFSVSCYPDGKGGFYNVDLDIEVKNQDDLGFIE